MKSLVNCIKKDKINFLFLLISLAFFIVIMAIVGGNFFSRFGVELEEGFRNDGALYFTVGRGIANGLRPYVDLFETKGPMLFYLCALGYLISGPNSYYFVNIFSFICLIVIALIPNFFVIIRFIKQKNKNYIRFCSIILSIFTFSFLLVSYAEYTAGRIYAEIFCSFYAIIAFLLLYLSDGRQLKFYSPTTIISGIFLCLAALTKETFAFISVVGILFICRTKRDLIYKFLLPFSYGIVFAFIFLLATNTLVPYFTIYITSMVNTWLHTSTGSGLPFFIKIIDFPNVILFIWRYSPILTILIIIEFLLSFYFIWKNLFYAQKELTGKNFIICLLYTLSLTFIIPFTLALGSPSFPHQHAVGMPIYVLLLLYLIDNIAFTHQLSFKPRKYKHHLCLTDLTISITSCLAIMLLSPFDYETKVYRWRLKEGKESALYVDKVLDILNEDHYQLLGEFFLCFYPYTNHSPLGPCFFQTNTMFKQSDSYLTKSFIHQIETVNVIVFTDFACGPLNDWIDDYLDSHFTDRLPDSIKDIEPPESFAYTAKFLFRAVTYF